MSKYLCFCHAPKWANRGDAAKVVVESASSYEASRKAADHFKLSPKQAHQVSVWLVEKDGKEVVHTADF